MLAELTCLLLSAARLSAEQRPVVHGGSMRGRVCENRASMSSVPASEQRPALIVNAPEPVGLGRIDLYWLPLGAGGHCVRLNGRVYEAVAARLQRRPACGLYHSALEVHVPEGRFVVEQTPVPSAGGAERGVVAGGPVGLRGAQRLRLFRYEVRRWRDGVIADVDEAVASPQRLSADPRRARRLLDLVPVVPTVVWGRDELGAGEMWNSNSIVAWLIERSGIAAETIPLPPGGRAPGWTAGVVVARRER